MGESGRRLHSVCQCGVREGERNSRFGWAVHAQTVAREVGLEFARMRRRSLFSLGSKGKSVMARSTLFSWVRILAAVSLSSALANTACSNNACLPSTTCVSGPSYSETFIAFVSPASDAAAEDGGADAKAEAGALDAGETEEADPSESLDANSQE
jgi:hypothetical protein